MIIREEIAVDTASVRRVNLEAFGGPDEAELVERLRADGAVLASFVAEEDSMVVGHVLFSRMHINTDGGAVEAVALAPVSVDPVHQRRGIGSALIEHGLAWLRERGEAIVLVVGHAEYYPRFGFSLQAAEFIESPFPQPVFMALALKPGALDGVRGRVRYAAAFGL